MAGSMGNSRRRHFRSAAVAWLLAATVVAGACAQTFDELMSESGAAAEASIEAQKRVDALARQTRSAMREFRSVSRQIEDLRRYNDQLERQIAEQRRSTDSLDASIAQLSGFQRELLPLTERMLDSLQRFIALDLPFRLAERQQRIAGLRELLDNPSIPVAEKYHEVLRAYRAELAYGTGLDAWTDQVTVGGAMREGTLLRIGRIALFFRSPDGNVSAMWNRMRRRWEVLEDIDADTLAEGIRVARGGVARELLLLPVPAPEGGS